MNVKVTKLSGLAELRRANEATTDRVSKMTLKQAYRAGHSPIRTQKFWVELRDIPTFVADHLVRHHVGIDHYRLSKRTDRGGADFDEECRMIEDDMLEAFGFDTSDDIEAAAERVRALPTKFGRNAPTTLCFEINAEALINMAHKRLCRGTVSRETREIVQAICDSVEEVDPDLYPYLVPPCVHTGFCRENAKCSFISGYEGQRMRTEYLNLFGAVWK